MFTKENYFRKVKFIKFGALPKDLQKLYTFTQEATENHTTWEYYDEDPDVSVPVDNYFKSLTRFLGIESENITEDMALDAAKDLIRSYVHRGDSLQSLKDGQLGAYNDEYGASIKSGKIVVEKIKKQKVDFSFPLENVFNEVAAEKKEHKKNESEPDKPEPKKTKAIKPRKMKPTTQKPASKPTAPAAEKKPLRINTSEGKQVERIEDEVKFIKRFLALHNRTKTKQQILNFINALQRAILEKRIRKTSKYSEEIMQIQKQLVTAFNVMRNGQRFEISEPTIKKFTEIAESYRVRISTQYLKRYIGIRGKTLTKEKAQNLVNLVLKSLERSKIASSDPYYKNIQTIVKALEKFIDVARSGDTLAVHQEALNGLNGVLECACLENEDLNGIETEQETEPEYKAQTEAEPETPVFAEPMTINQVRKMEFDLVPVTGKWLKLIGKFCLPTHFFIYGRGGGGKSSLALLFCDYLASIGFKCLYIAAEQLGTPTFTNLVNTLKLVGGPNFEVTGLLDESLYNPADYDFVVLDSKDILHFDIEDFVALTKQYPKQSFIVIPHATKTGGFRGKEQWRNVMDVMIECTDGLARTGHDKNRWGGAGEMRVFEPNLRRQEVA